MPLGAVLFSDKLLNDLKNDSALFFHGYTYSGHPACCAAALKNIEIIKRDKILEHVQNIAPYFHQQLKKLYDLPIVGDIRGKGLMAGIECVINKDSKEALVLDKAIGSRIDEESLKLGLIIRPLYHICVLSPALIISKNCGVSEYIEDNKNGILIKPSSLDLKNAIEYYYNNPKLINYHGINNYKFFKKSLLNSSESYKAFVSLIKKNYENSF